MLSFPKRLALLAGAALAATFVPITYGAGPACAGATSGAAETGRAVLVVDTGEAVYRYCVALPDGDTSGIELIEAAGDEFDLDYRLGYGGNAVCMLAGVGTSGDDCFEDYPDFWGYWRGDGSGGWSWSSVGAGSTTVSDGDVEGWSWGSGNDGNSHAAPPQTEFAAVCSQQRSAEPARRPRVSRSDQDEPAATDPAPTVFPSTPAVDDQRRRESESRRSRDRPRRLGAGRVPGGPASPIPSPSVLQAAPAGGRGIPPAGVAALLGAGLVLALATLVARRRLG